MKTTIKLFFVAATISLIASCAKNPGNLLIDKNGTWAATIVTTIDNLNSYTNTYDITFYEGSATQTDTAGYSTSFNWYYDKKAEQIVISIYDGTNTTTILQSVSNIEKDSEKWTYKSTAVNGAVIALPGYSQETTLKRI